MFEPVAAAAVALAAELFENVDKQILRRTAAGQGRHGADHPGRAAEVAQREAHAFQCLKVGFDDLRLIDGEFDGHREQQVLRGHFTVHILFSQILEQQTLMGGVLVDDHQVVAVSAEDIEILEAADHHQVIDADRFLHRSAGGGAVFTCSRSKLILLLGTAELKGCRRESLIPGLPSCRRHCFMVSSFIGGVCLKAATLGSCQARRVRRGAVGKDGPSERLLMLQHRFPDRAADQLMDRPAVLEPHLVFSRMHIDIDAFRLQFEVDEDGVIAPFEHEGAQTLVDRMADQPVPDHPPVDEEPQFSGNRQARFGRHQQAADSDAIDSRFAAV